MPCHRRVSRLMASWRSRERAPPSCQRGPGRVGVPSHRCPRGLPRSPPPLRTVGSFPRGRLPPGGPPRPAGAVGRTLGDDRPPGVGAAWRLDDLISNLDSVIMRRKHRSQVQATCKCLEHTPALLRGAVTLLTMAPGQSRGRWPSAPALPPADSASSKPWISLMVLSSGLCNLQRFMQTG